jgi:sugar diacid utilization regulator
VSRELTSESDRLRDVVALAAETTGIPRVTLHLRRPGREDLAVAATSDRADQGPMARAARPLRMGDPLIARVLNSPKPLLVTEGGQQGRCRILVRLVDWSGEPFGLLAFDLDNDHAAAATLAGTGPSPSEPEMGRLATVAAIAEQAIGAISRASALERANASMRARAEVDRALGAVVQHGGGLSAVVRECATLTGKVVGLFDHDGRQLTSAHVGAAPNVRLPGIHEILARCGPVSVDGADPFIAPAGATGLSRRKIVAPVSAGDERFGWLVIDEHPSGFRALDRFVAERSAALLESEFVVQRRVARVAWNAKTSLARQMVRGTQSTEDLMASADYLGVDTGARRVLAYVLDPTASRADESLDQGLAASVEQELGVEVLATRGSEGMLLLVEAPEDRATVAVVNEVKAALGAATERLCSPNVIVGVSTVCEPTALSRGYREAREVVRCIDRFAGRSAQRILAVDDLGPARLFLANSDTSAIRGYVIDVLGPLLTGDPAMTDLLTTLQCYFDASRSVRASAAQLGVHENTIRLRLARVTTATGLDVAGDANDQLSVQTALLVLRLQGHPTLPWLGSGAHAPHGEGTQDQPEVSRSAARAVGPVRIDRKSA